MEPIGALFPGSRRRLWGHHFPLPEATILSLNLHKSDNELSFDLHLFVNELSLDLHKSGNELSLDLHKSLMN